MTDKHTGLKILIIGQTPPPYGGQAVLINHILRGNYTGLTLYHVRMAFSDEMDQIGRFYWKKILRLIAIVIEVYRLRFREDITALYYPPAPSATIPVLRDLVILLMTRWLFSKVIFHFHAYGVSSWCKRRSRLVRALFARAYFYSDAAIHNSCATMEDARELRTKRDFIIPCGIADVAKSSRLAPCRLSSSSVPVILYVGAVSEEKGALVLLEAVGALRSRGERCQVNIVGKFTSSEFESVMKETVHRYHIDEDVHFLGVLTGEEKNDAYRNGDIFCFPSHASIETFGIVVLEAMSFGLPVVAAQWRAMPEVIQDGINGLLFPVKDAAALANCIHGLIQDPDMRRQLGRNGRSIFEKEYTLDRYYERIANAFRAVGG